MPSVGFILRDPHLYLRKVIQSLKKTMEIAKGLVRRTRLESKLGPPVYQFREHNLTATGGAYFQLDERNI